MVATFTWTFYVRQAAEQPVTIKEFSATQVFPFFITALILRIIYQIGINSGYLWLIIPGSVISLLRAMTGSIGFLAVITISYLLGKKLLNKMQAVFFLILMAILLFVTGVSLYLNLVGSYLLLAMIGWMLGSNKIPWRLLVVSTLIIMLLNIGKGETRHYYWTIRDSSIHPTEYIQVYKDWFDNSFESIQQPKNKAENQNQNSLIHRSSVVHMLLKVQTETGIEKPYLWGETYSLIPQLLIPRFINSNKIRGGEANHILSVHYGLQTYEQTQTTSIGWGILQEAYANFGWLGCWGLGIFIGSLYGWITRWTMNVSCLSFRFLVALIFMILTLRSEVTMGTFISVIFQSLVILTAIRMFFMKTVSTNNQCQNLL